MYFITHNSVKRRKVADLMDHDSHPYEREKVCHNGMKVEMDFRGIVNNSNLHIPWHSSTSGFFFLINKEHVKLRSPIFVCLLKPQFTGNQYVDQKTQEDHIPRKSAMNASWASCVPYEKIKLKAQRTFTFV